MHRRHDAPIASIVPRNGAACRPASRQWQFSIGAYDAPDAALRVARRITPRITALWAPSWNRERKWEVSNVQDLIMLGLAGAVFLGVGLWSAWRHYPPRLSGGACLLVFMIMFLIIDLPAELSPQLKRVVRWMPISMLLIGFACVVSGEEERGQRARVSSHV